MRNRQLSSFFQFKAGIKARALIALLAFSHSTATSYSSPEDDAKRQIAEFARYVDKTLVNLDEEIRKFTDFERKTLAPKYVENNIKAALVYASIDVNQLIANQKLELQEISKKFDEVNELVEDLNEIDGSSPNDYSGVLERYYALRPPRNG